MQMQEMWQVCVPLMYQPPPSTWSPFGSLKIIMVTTHKNNIGHQGKKTLCTILDEELTKIQDQ